MFSPRSSTNAVSGDGLDEAVQWLSGERLLYIVQAHCYLLIAMLHNVNEGSRAATFYADYHTADYHTTAMNI